MQDDLEAHQTRISDMKQEETVAQEAYTQEQEGDMEHTR